jgi:hypothetical protein
MCLACNADKQFQEISKSRRERVQIKVTLTIKEIKVSKIGIIPIVA